ncbi:MAG: hypothetical protein Q8N99_03070 [Nanoarchaeota archaeon]|nr:hypothetical protein [Nanoarchaeota archaeon]
MVKRKSKNSLKQIKKKKEGKRGSIELSMGTIVVLVLAMLMLTLGLVLVRSIFRVATESVDQINDKVKNEITNLFAEENSKVVVKLGADHTAKIKQGSESFGIGIGARTYDGSTVSKNLKFKLRINENDRESCFKKIGRSGIKEMFIQNLDTYMEFDESDMRDIAFARLLINVKEGTPICQQKVYVDVKDGDKEVGKTYFIVQLVRKGFFG